MNKLIVTASLAFSLSATAASANPFLFGDLFGPPYTCETILDPQPLDLPLCKRRTPVTYETHRHRFSGPDVSWHCAYGSTLEISFFNSSSTTVTLIAIEGATSGTRLTADVLVGPGRSGRVSIVAAVGFCARESSARIYGEHRVALGGDCIETYSPTELRNMQEDCRIAQEEEQLRARIYDNCIIERSRGAAQAALASIRRVCGEISRNPSWLQRWRWGN